MSAPRLAILVTAIAGAAWCWHCGGFDRGDDIGRALRSGQWELAQQRIDRQRRQHGRSAEAARWQTALDLAARGPQVAREGRAPVESPEAPSGDLPFESPEFVEGRPAADATSAESAPVVVDAERRVDDGPVSLVTR